MPTNHSNRLASLGARLRTAYGVAQQTFGARQKPLVAGAGYLAMRGLNSVGLALDDLFFPALRQVRVERPIVIVGNPRTGTTFLHRFLCDHHYGTGQAAWRMAIPSLTLQSALAPLLPLIERFSPTRHYQSAAHQTSPTSIETDDAALLLRHFDGFFLYGFLFAFHDDELRDHFLPELRDTSARDFAWLNETWRRSLVANHDTVVVAKLLSLGARLPAFQAAFPDARVLYMARDPLAVIPSALSLVTGVLDSVGGFWSLPEPTRNRWLTRLYPVLVDLLRRFHDDWHSGAIDRTRVHIVRYDHMMSDFGHTMDTIHTFLGVTPSDGQREAIAAQAKTQRTRRSEHHYALDRFGLTEAQVRHDTAFFTDTFLAGPDLADVAKGTPS